MNKTIGLLLIIVSMAGMYFYIGGVKNVPEKGSTYYKIMEYDFEKEYPKTPIQTLEIYGETVKYLYGEEVIEKSETKSSEIEDIIYKQRKLLDKEVLDVTPENVQYERVKTEIKEFKDNNLRIINFKIMPDIVQEDPGIISIKVIEYTNKYNRIFLEYYMRKDKQDKWKVLGWKKVEPF